MGKFLSSDTNQGAEGSIQELESIRVEKGALETLRGFNIAKILGD